MLLQLGFKTLKQREGIGCAAGKSGQNAALIKTSYFSGGCLDDDIAKCDLSITRHGDRIPAPHRQNCRAVILLHNFFLVL